MKCDRKHRFDNEQAAEDSAALINAGNRAQRPRQTMRVYRCWHCSKWHLTSQPQRRKRAA